MHLAPPAEQPRLVQKIANSGNAYAIDIAASNLQSDEVRSTLTPAAKLALQKMLEANQPGFSTAVGEFGLQEAIIYADWLHALAALTAENNRISYDQVILNHLDSEMASPKKAIAYFSSEKGQATARRIGRARLSKLHQRISAYSDRLPYPQNPLVKDLVQRIVRIP
jgi:hypothetical protein